MQKWCCSLFLIVFLLSSCAHHKTKAPLPKPSKIKQYKASAPTALPKSIKVEQHKKKSLSALLSFFKIKQNTPKVPAALPIPIKIIQTRLGTPFNQVDIEGQVNVSVHTGYRQPQAILKGDSRDVAAVKTIVSKNTLYLIVPKGYPVYGPLYADVRSQNLNRLTAKGVSVLTGRALHTSSLAVYLSNTGSVRLGGYIGLHVLNIKGKGLTQISDISSQNLQINLQGNPKVQLSGVANLANLTMQENAWLSLYWVKTDTLTVRAKKKATIQLAGAVNRLDVELWDNARFKGRYLRAQRSFVRTHDHSVAEISTAKHQSDYATDASDIYYYNLASTRADFMPLNGSVLDMREWDQFDLKDFNRYNKQFP